MSKLQTILVVDDDAFIRKPLEYILEQEGFEARIACDGDECLEQVKKHRPDLIILDVMMPKRDGFEVCEVLKSDAELRDIPVILLSARGRENDQRRGIELGAADFMTKPYSPSELIGRVRELLDEAALAEQGKQGRTV
ncbi:MAG: response regulator [Acidobacteriota bacterium]|nr:response regulator [Acidobacteriota bacterium]MDH3784606.1 response regulator [Acidobacteriota bacterium]